MQVAHLSPPPQLKARRQIPLPLLLLDIYIFHFRILRPLSQKRLEPIEHIWRPSGLSDDGAVWVVADPAAQL
jgi:hypothetical protein